MKNSKFRFTYQKRSKVLEIANALKKEQGWSFSMAQKRAWDIVRFMVACESGEVVLRFTKPNDEIPQQRIACAISKENYTYKGGNRKSNPLQIAYFDQNRNSVRSFNAARFVGFKEAA